jgi:hypothetical protein
MRSSFFLVAQVHVISRTVALAALINRLMCSHFAEDL